MPDGSGIYKPQTKGPRLKRKGDEIAIILPEDAVHTLRVVLAPGGYSAAQSASTEAFRRRLDRGLARMTAPKEMRTLRWPSLNDMALEAAASEWSRVIDDVSEEMQGFALSIAKLLKQRGEPSEKQAALMKKLHREFLVGSPEGVFEE